MSRGSKIITLRVPDALLAQMQEYMSGTNRESDKGLVGGYSLWIRECIEQRLGHVKRSKKLRKNYLSRCDECGLHVGADDVAAEWRSLYGKKAFRCEKCDTKPA